jgi:hypothetical protein
MTPASFPARACYCSINLLHAENLPSSLPRPLL